MDQRRHPTPRAAVLPLPRRSVPAGIRAEEPTPLREAVYLSTATGDHTLFAERVLIGRGEHCRVVVLDPLVSREHAVLLIGRSSVIIEDLHSANGVYVNNVRIFTPQPLRDGDRILVGTNEMAAFAVNAETRPPLPRRRFSLQPSVSVSPGASTDRADAITVLGSLADRMLEQGLPAEAERVLADHLERLLTGVRSGLPLPAKTCEGAARYALRLARSLHDGRWIDYTVELHLRGEVLLAPGLVPELEAAFAACRNVDPVLYGYYVEWVRQSIPREGREARRVLDALDHARLP